ncbi:hypothetical protein LTR86_001410 [Recurvomyces mirabilis]|nr:hypothetical protein LTR86_001410 [Recurvomyces mirabilis]
MARFKPIYIRRSDGRLEMIGKGKHRERNEPTPEQLDTTADKHGVSDFYREVGPEDAKSMDWRRKLGGMLARELGVDERGSDHSYVLVAFPEHYRLFEHVKKTVRDGKTEVKAKTHAGGGNDRQDAYLYGHPAGRRKRFRSPADFFPHLLWLATDESGDADNCGCKICSPEDLEAAIPGAKAKVDRPSKQASDSSRSIPAVSRQSSAQSIKSEPVTIATRPTSTTVPPTPTALPKPRNADQQLDRRYYNFMYRAGELVWFKRGQAWGLGTVLRRWLQNQGHPNQYHYLVQPLSYPGHNTSASIKCSDAEFRPWLAWSVPKFTHDGLNHLPLPAHYNSADWQGIAQKRYGHGELEVDASILAAKAVDATYTPFEAIKSSEPEPGTTEASYNGIYLGAEQVWVGDPVRLQVGSGTDIMIIHTIIERARGTPAASSSSLNLIGDIYRLTSVTHRPGDNNPHVYSSTSGQNDNPYLPPRLIEDLRDRNNHSIAARGTASYWKLTTAKAKIGLNDVKGRWYEASLLLPILQQGQYEALSRKGDVQEATLWMNARGDCQNSNKPADQPTRPVVNTRKATRQEAFGRAIPSGAEIKFGVQPPLPDNVDPALQAGGAGNDDIMQIDPRFDTADYDGRAQGADPAASGLDEFMNLDAADMPGFGQDYASQASQGGYF